MLYEPSNPWFRIISDASSKLNCDVTSAALKESSLLSGNISFSDGSMIDILMSSILS